jgi:hypothetical protein
MFVALVALLVVLSGCAEVWSEADLVGTWVHRTPTGESAEITLEGDGSATADTVPRVVFIPTAGGLADVDWTDTVSASGRWEMSESGEIVLSLVDDDGAALGPKLFVDGGDGIELYAFVGPAESAIFRFTRD